MQKVNLAMAVSTVSNMRQILVSNKNRIAKSLPKSSSISAEKIISTAIEVTAGNQKLLQCTGQSILLAVKQACEFGLSFSKVFGQAYLVPFKTQAQLIIGYRGLLDLSRRALGEGVVFDSDVVYSGDVFEITKGTKTEIIHKPNLTAERKEKDIMGAYFVATFGDGKQVVEYMTIDDIKLIRARSKAYQFNQNENMWVTDFSAMCRKTVIRRGIKYLPLSSEKARIIEKALEHDILTDGISDTPKISAKDKLKALEAELVESGQGETAQNGTQTTEIRQISKKQGKTKECTSTPETGEEGANLTFSD